MAARKTTAADHRAHLALDWAARHGPVSGPLAMATTSMAVASTGALAGMPSGWPLAIGAIGAAAHGIGAGLRKRLSRPSLATRAAGWLLSSGWTSAVIATDPTTWSGKDTWTALAALAAITIGVGGAAYAAEVHEEAVDDARRALQAAMAEAEVAREDWATIDAWMALIRQVSRVPVEFGGGFTRRPNGSGFALEISLPVGVSSDRIASYAQTLAEAARLPSGCLVRIERAGRQGHLILDVDTQDMAALSTRYPVEEAEVPLTINGRVPWAVDRSGHRVELHLREACALIIGPPGSAKTTLLEGIVASFSRCPDVLVWAMDIGKQCADFKHWNRPWLEAQGRVDPPAGTPRPPEDTQPVIDWMATTLVEAEEMLDAMLAIGEQRLTTTRSTKLLEVTSQQPMIFCIIDEGVEMLNYEGRDPLKSRVRTKIVQVIRTLRAMGIRLILTATDGNVSSLGDSAVRKYSPVRVALTATDAEGASVAKLFGRVKGIDIRQLRSKGSGVIGAVTGDPETEIYPTAMRTFLTDATLHREMAIRTRHFRPALEKAAAEAAGNAYAERWSPGNLDRLFGATESESTPAGTKTRQGKIEYRRTLDLPSRASDSDSPKESKQEETPRPKESQPLTDADLAKLLSDLARLPEATEPAPEKPKKQAGPVWLPQAIQAIRESGADGMKVGAIAEIVGLDRKTVRTALRACEELVYRDRGPHSCYVHRDYA
ncbi:hypothetical protein AB0L74_34475 [Streptomyces sp. NPDC052020]|uniref:hypothetical protein n=1 Tax=Streptomyces sp. NPDC052020 TaxID=3155677 RepID=UPI003442F2EE